MRRVYKYEFPIRDAFTLELPQGAQILRAESQRGATCLWALVDPGQPLETRLFALRGTGHDISLANIAHVSTFQMLQGELVWHLFEVLQEAR